jgi:predicted DNA-binding transcriptional regulator YafY
MKTDRLIAIVLYLLSREKVTAREFAEYFGVTLRTIYRDMDALNLAGVPIVSTQGVEGGYGLVDSFTLNRAFFKEDELLALFTALAGINSAIKDKSIETALLKLKALSKRPRDSGKKPERLPPVVYVPIPWGVPQAWSRLLETIREAIDLRRVLSFTYTKADGRSARRRVEPLTLVLQADVWYLYAWDLRKKDYRFFRLSRISSLAMEKDAFFVAKPGRRPFPWETTWETAPPTEIRLRFSREAAQKARDMFPWCAPEPLDDGSLVMTVSFAYDDWVQAQILSFGPGVEVLEPDWIRAKVLELAERTADRYRAPSAKPLRASLR